MSNVAKRDAKSCQKLHKFAESCSKMVKSRQRDAKKHKGLLRKELLIGSTEKICLHLKRKLLDFWDTSFGTETLVLSAQSGLECEGLGEMEISER